MAIIGVVVVKITILIVFYWHRVGWQPFYIYYSNDNQPQRWILIEKLLSCSRLFKISWTNNRNKHSYTLCMCKWSDIYHHAYIHTWALPHTYIHALVLAIWDSILRRYDAMDGEQHPRGIEHLSCDRMGAVDRAALSSPPESRNALLRRHRWIQPQQLRWWTEHKRDHMQAYMYVCMYVCM